MPLQKHIDAIATAKIKRALDSKKSVGGQQLGYAEGELVDHYTEPNQKDISGWRGPARFIKNIPEQGKVQLEWMNTEIYTQYKDVDWFTDFSTLILYGFLGCTYPAMNALQYIATYVFQLPQCQLCEIGYVRSENALRLTKHSTTQLVSAMHFVVDAMLQLCNVQTVRTAHGGKYFGKVRNVKHTILMWWQQNMNSITYLNQMQPEISRLKE